MVPRTLSIARGPLIPTRSLIGAAFVYLLDAFVMNQGAIAVLAALITLVTLFVALISGVIRRDFGGLLTSVVRAGAFVFAAAAVLVTNAWQNQAARGRAEEVIDACERYHADAGRYPDALADLVPRFLLRVPRAKYVLGFGDFTYYSSNPMSHTLQYTSLPPFGRPYYIFEERRWGYLD